MADTKPEPLCRRLVVAGLWRYPSLWSNTELKRLGCQFQNVDPDYMDYNKDHNWVGNAPCSRLATARRPSLTEMFAIHPHHPTRLECLTDILAWSPSWEKGPFPNLRYRSCLMRDSSPQLGNTFEELTLLIAKPVLSSFKKSRSVETRLIPWWITRYSVIASTSKHT